MEPREVPSQSYSYQIIPTAPEVPKDDVESSVESTLEIVLLWGDSVLQVFHIPLDREFALGADDLARGVDFVVPSEVLGCTRHVLVRATASSVTVLAPPTTRVLSLQRLGATEETRLINTDSELGASQPELSLQLGECVRVSFGPVRAVVSWVAAGKAVPRKSLTSDNRGLAYFAATAGLTAAWLGVTAFMVPSLHGLTTDINDEQVYLIQQYLNAEQERQRERELSEEVGKETSSGAEEGARAPAEEGKTGLKSAPYQARALAIKGKADTLDPRAARQQALEEATTFGTIGLLNTASLSGLLPGYERDMALGQHDLNANGDLWSDTLGDAFGEGGLALSGIGEGAGGKFGIIGLGEIGMGPGAPGCKGEHCERGFGGGPTLGGSYRPKDVGVRMAGDTTVSGRLPKSTIQRVVRQNFGRFRMCYQDGLRTNPNLEGRVAVRFVIGRGGAVENAQNGGSSMPSSDVVSCVTRAFYGLSFPAPEDGIVTVVYPINFFPA